MNDKMIFARAAKIRGYTNEKPPKTLADVLEMALYDLSLAEVDPKVEIAMDRAWFFEREDGHCFVCFAGAVMRNRGPDWERHTPMYYALNDLRDGRVQEASIFYGRTRVNNRRVTSYETDPQKFRKDMEQILKELRAEEKKNG